MPAETNSSLMNAKWVSYGTLMPWSGGVLRMGMGVMLHTAFLLQPRSSLSCYSVTAAPAWAGPRNIAFINRMFRPSM